ncbi:fibronectin type III domain-containing protein [Aliikangiella maris]|uniref:Fibronectin type III domain-containing protein n=2 Tax=Aliikangiella maris TaxID=3162458 RepID=A0ABV3MKR2_9GAMM
MVWLKSQGNFRIHETEVSGLQANTTYFYRVKTGNTTSAIYQFTTPADSHHESNIHLVTMSDMQIDSSNPDQFQQVVEDGNNYAQWKNDFFTPLKQLTPYVLIYLLRQ